MTVPRNQEAEAVELGDMQSCRVHVKHPLKATLPCGTRRLIHAVACINGGPLSSPPFMWTAPWSVSADQSPVFEQFW